MEWQDIVNVVIVGASVWGLLELWWVWQAWHARCGWLKEKRGLKPRTPEACPACGGEHERVGRGRERKAGVKPWGERKSKRGKKKKICTEGVGCPSGGCDYYRNTEPSFHAIVGDGKRGKREKIQQWRCQACGTRFSSRRGTALYRLHTAASQVGQALLGLNLGLTLADVQVLFGYAESTLQRWVTRAGEHSELLHAHFFHELILPHIQFDELYTHLRDKAEVVWLWTAIEPRTKLIPALKLGGRTQAMAYQLVHGVMGVMAEGSVPICTSDGLDHYYYALTAHVGEWVTEVETGIRRWRVAAGWLYGQVVKRYRRKKLVEVEQRMRAGGEDELEEALQGLGYSGKTNTAFIERLNLTLRQAIAALTRRGWGTAQLTDEMGLRLESWRGWYHFCRRHQGLRVKLTEPQARRGKQSPRRYIERTPAMTAGLTDHIWTIEEMLAYPIPAAL